jgi:hypothetical protein
MKIGNMNAKFSRNGFLKFCLLAGCFFGGVRSAFSAEVTMSDHYDNLELLKKGIPWASKWWNVDSRGKSFAVCLQREHFALSDHKKEAPWRKDADGSFALVWSYRTLGVGPIDVEIEEGKASFRSGLKPIQI